MIFSVVFVQISIAQSVSDFSNYITKYKEKDLVFLNIKTEIMVNVGKNDLEITETKFEESYYNNFKAGAFSDSKIQSNHFSKLKDIEASTLLPENNKFKELKVKEFKTQAVLDDNVFYNDLISTSFNYPSLCEGAITRLKYSLEITNPKIFPIEIFQQYYNVENFEYVINADKNVNFEFKTFNIDTFNISFTKEEKGNRIIYSWKAKNIPSYKTDKRAPDYLWYLPHIIPYIKTYTINGEEKIGFRNIDDYFNWYYNFILAIDHKHTDEMKQIANDLVKNCKSDLEKVEAIYKWVQKNIKYVAFEFGLGGFMPRNPYQIFEKRYGDCKDMATIIVELLDICGVKAYYTLIGTRDLPYRFNEVPTNSSSNHMITTYIENGKYYYLDATASTNSFGLPTPSIQDKEALILLNKDKYEITKVPIINLEQNSHIDSLNIKIIDNKIIGNGTLFLNGYYSSNMKDVLEKITDPIEKQKFLKNALGKGSNKFLLDNYSVLNIKDNLQINYNFNIADYYKSTENEIYLNMNFVQPFEDDELLKKDRVLDYEFYFKSKLVIICNFSIPENFNVSYLPESSKFEKDNIIYDVHYEIKDNKIVYYYNIKIDAYVLKPNNFENWNKLLKQMRSDFKNTIVLTKK